MLPYPVCVSVHTSALIPTGQTPRNELTTSKDTLILNFKWTDFMGVQEYLMVTFIFLASGFEHLSICL